MVDLSVQLMGYLYCLQSPAVSRVGVAPIATGEATASAAAAGGAVFSASTGGAAVPCVAGVPVATRVAVVSADAGEAAVIAPVVPVAIGGTASSSHILRAAEPGGASESGVVE